MLTRRKFLSSSLCCAAGAFLVGCGGSQGSDPIFTGGSGSGGSTSGDNTSGSSSASFDACSPDNYVPNYSDEAGSLYFWRDLPLQMAITTTTYFGSTLVEDLLREGFQRWSNPTGGSADWREVSVDQNPPATAAIVQVPERPRVLGQTRMVYTRQVYELQRAEITVHIWPNMTTEEIDGLVATAAHEIGHAFGIGGHSAHSGDLMYAFGNGTSQPTSRDVNTLRTAYCGFDRSITRVPGDKDGEEGILIRCPRHA